MNGDLWEKRCICYDFIITTWNKRIHGIIEQELFVVVIVQTYYLSVQIGMERAFCFDICGHPSALCWWRNCWCGPPMADILAFEVTPSLLARVYAENTNWCSSRESCGVFHACHRRKSRGHVVHLHNTAFCSCSGEEVQLHSCGYIRPAIVLESPADRRKRATFKHSQEDSCLSWHLPHDNELSGKYWPSHGWLRTSTGHGEGVCP